MKASQAYFDLPPNAAAPVPVLKELLETLPRATPEDHFVAANIHLELTRQLGDTDSQASHHDLAQQALEEASRGLVPREMHALRSRTQLLQASMPAYLEDYPHKTKRRVASELFNLMRSDMNLFYANKLPSEIHGRRTEVLMILALGHAGITGLKARPSFARQEDSEQYIEDKKYNWDVTIESDGSTIAPGTYGAQVKSRERKHFRKYHPSIARISYSTLGLTSTDPRAFTELATAVYIDPSSPAVVRAQESLLERLEIAGPQEDGV